MIDQCKITHQSFFDLSMWLSNPDKYTNEQLIRLQTEDEYLPLISLAHQYWLVGALTNQLKSVNVWESLSDELITYLIEIERVYYKRINSMKEETVYVSQLLVDENIDVIVMKGAAHLFNGAADPISNRYMKDIDILVPEQIQQKAYEILRKNGYEKDVTYFDVNAKNMHHAPPLLKNNVCYIEIHRWVLSEYLNKVLDTNDVWSASIELGLTTDLAVKQLSPTHQVILSITHSELQNGGHDQKHVDLHQFFNLLSIIKNFSKEIDWETVKQYFDKSDQGYILKTTLYTMYRLFGLETPITDKKCIYAKKHFDKCLNAYVKNQGIRKGFSIIMEQLYGYNRRNINLRYGKFGIFGYPIGVIKHIYFHFRKIISFPHIKPYVLRIFNKN